MDITKNGGLTILIVDLDLRQLQTLGEIGSCLETARENHHEAIYTNPHIIPLLPCGMRMINLDLKKSG
jgi:hypothetical protein